MQPTLLIDEADTFLQGNEELRGILNSGYTAEDFMEVFRRYIPRSEIDALVADLAPDREGHDSCTA